MSTAVIIFGVVGTFLVGAAGCQLCLALYESLRRARFRREAVGLSLELLRQRVDAACQLRSRTEPANVAWNGYRKFVVQRKELEAENIYSFYLSPHDGKPLPRFLPGQFLTIQLRLPAVDKPVVRCYSLSDCPHGDHYRITVKRCLAPTDAPDAPHGVISGHLHDRVAKGDILDVKAPSGRFFIDTHKRKPAVLIGGGIGITPFLSMASTVVESGSGREIWMFYGVRNGREHILSGYLRELSHQHDQFHFVACYSNPGPDDVEGRDYDYRGRIDRNLLQRYLKSSNYEFFVCGPPPMMSAVTKALVDWSVPESEIRTEAFGPASVPKRKKEVATPATSAVKITFSRSQKTVAWDGKSNSLLDFGEDVGAQVQGGCRVGNCGTCEVAVLAGEVEYNCKPEYSDLGDGCCLACISTPKGDLVLDA